MRVSGKITHSFYCFLQVRGFDESRFFELTDLEMEFLKDPSSWLDISKVDLLLKNLDQEYASHFVDKDFISCVGNSCFELSSWGELDSVLKMKKTKPLFSHLPVFLSYFISEGFSLSALKQTEGFLSYKSSLSSEEHPFVIEYLRSVLESLPLYSGGSKADVKWIRDYIQIKWEEDQESRQNLLFSAPLGVNLKPEILRDFRQFLEKIEKELYNNQQLIVKKNKEISSLKDQLIMQGLALPEEIEIRLKQIEEDIKSIKQGAELSSAPVDRWDSILRSVDRLKEILVKDA